MFIKTTLIPIMSTKKFSTFITTSALCISLASCSSTGPNYGSAPVASVATSANARAAHNTPQEIPVEITATPLPNGQAIERKALNTQQPVSPVVKKLLQQSQQASQEKAWPQAEAHLERALRINPRNALVWQRLSQVKLQQGKWHQAIQFASKSNTLARRDHSLKQQNWRTIADANQRLGQPERAKAAWERSRSD